MTYKFKQKSHQHYYDLLEEGLTFHSTRTGHFRGRHFRTQTMRHSHNTKRGNVQHGITRAAIQVSQ